MALSARQNKSMIILDSLSSYPRSFKLFWTLLGIVLDNPFSFNGNGVGASGRMQRHFVLDDSLVFRNLTDFSFRDISVCKTIRSLFLWFAMGPDTKIVFRQVHRSSFLAARHQRTCPGCPVFNHRNFYLLLAFDLL